MLGKVHYPAAGMTSIAEPRKKANQNTSTKTILPIYNKLLTHRHTHRPTNFVASGAEIL